MIDHLYKLDSDGNLKCHVQRLSLDEELDEKQEEDLEENGEILFKVANEPESENTADYTKMDIAGPDGKNSDVN